MRVAVCISGQMRTYAAAAPSLIERIIEPYGADVFVHTWSDRGTSNNVHNRMLPSPMRSYLKAQGDLEHFRAAFPRTYEELFAAVDAVTPDDLRRVYGEDATVVVEDYPENEREFFGVFPPERLLGLQPKSRWSVPMFYKVDACNRLKSEKEAAEGFTYDVVIRMRPDLTAGSDFIAGRTDTRGVLHHRIRTIDPKWQVADQIFFGDSAAMDQVTALFSRLPEIYESVPEPLDRSRVAKYWAEGLLHTYITEFTDVTPVAFRTEPYNVRSEYRMLDTVEERIGFEKFFWGFREDALTAPDPSVLDTARRGCARALFHFCQPLRGEQIDRARKIADVAEQEALFDVRLTRGLLAYKDKDFLEVERIFEELVDEEPDAALHLLWLGRAKQELGKSAEALEYLDRAIAAPLEYDSQNPAQRWPMFLWRGRVHESNKRWTAAAESYEIANGLAPHKFETLQRLGRVQHAAGNHHRASTALQEAHTIKPENREVKFLLADCFVRTGIFKPVVSDLWAGTVEETAADYPRVLPVLAAAYLGLGKRDVARHCLDEFLADPARLATAGERVVTLAEQVSPEYGDTVRARVPLNDAKSPTPGDRPPVERLARSTARRGVNLLRRTAQRLRRAG